MKGCLALRLEALFTKFYLLDDSAATKAPEYALLQSSIDLFVPDDVEFLDVKDYMAIRQDYEGIRRSFLSYLRDIAGDHNLGLPQSPDAFLNNMTSAREEIHKDLAAVTKAVGSQRFNTRTAFALETATTVSSAVLGVNYPNPLGAIIASGLGYLGSKLANRLSTVSETYNAGLVSIAMSKAKIESRVARQTWDAPTYWKQR